MADVPGLATLARLHRVQTSFYDVDGRRRNASPEALLAVLRALGAPVASMGDVPAALDETRRSARALEPVTVAWRGRPARVDVRLPAANAGRPIRCELTLEGGDVRRWTAPTAVRTFVDDVAGPDYRLRRLSLPARLPAGYHRLALEVGGQRFETLVVSAPGRAFAPPGGPRRSWGLFMPTYALRTQRDWGAGDLTDLGALMHWVAELGGRTVATLPLLASFLDTPFEPSPYAPASRLFWNELYLDVERAPELADCEPARAVIASPRFQREVERLRNEKLVDYRALARLKRSLLEPLAASLFAKRSRRRAELEAFLEAQPEVREYARFRAAGERFGVPWHDWPARQRDGSLRPSDCDRDTERYHLYAQWLAHQQLGALSSGTRSSGVHLHLDMPLGTHPDGYDVWRERELFATGASAGAPPDTFFPTGQDWGFRPPHPEAQREQGYRHFVACLRHHLRYAGSLRIDHIMGLHRLYWIPRGGGPREGVYVRYPEEELYAILCLESHRHRAGIVGEDLGTVPQRVRRSMSRHGLLRSYVLQIEPTISPDQPFGRVPPASVASLDTHDTPPFAAFWRGLDTRMKRRLGALSARAAAAERTAREQHKRSLVAFLRRRGLLRRRESGEEAVLRACLAHLAGGRARALLVALEDLWLESDAQNVPGTSDEHPNWRRRARYSLDEVRNRPELVDILRDVDARRKGRRPGARAR